LALTPLDDAGASACSLLRTCPKVNHAVVPKVPDRLGRETYLVHRFHETGHLRGIHLAWDALYGCL
jgi:hypothetical protein